MIKVKWIIYLKKERHVVSLFREKAACTPDLAVPPASLDPDWANYRAVLNRMIAQGSLVRVFDKMFYLDEQRLLQIHMNRFKWGLVGLLIVCLFFMGFWGRW